MEFRPTKRLNWGHWLAVSILFAFVTYIAWPSPSPASNLLTLLLVPLVAFTWACAIQSIWRRIYRVEIDATEVRDRTLFRTLRLPISEIEKIKVTHMASEHHEYLAIRLFDGSLHKIGKHLSNEAHFKIMRHLIRDDERHHLGQWYYREI